VASLSQGRTAAAQCGLFTHKSVPVIFEPPCTRWNKIQKIFRKSLRWKFTIRCLTLLLIRYWTGNKCRFTGYSRVRSAALQGSSVSWMNKIASSYAFVCFNLIYLLLIFDFVVLSNKYLAGAIDRKVMDIGLWLKTWWKITAWKS